MTMHVPEHFRVRSGVMRSDEGYGCNGAFVVKLKAKGVPAHTTFAVIASDEGGWEHVSVSLRNRCPTWDEMCAVKAMFWDDEDCVVQYHPPKSTYVNNHPYCLHLWRCTTGAHVPMPPTILVGLPEASHVRCFA